MKKIITEVCAETVNSAIAAEAGGADRIELCQALSEGGLTPSPALTKWCCENLKLEVMVLIRPRPGDFLYNETEFEIILEDILFCREAGAKGVVVGFLNPDGSVDTGKLKMCMEVAGDMEVTFHRAFDRCNNWEKALEDIIACGCHRILTSGLYSTALEGKDLLKKIINKSAGRIKILAGSGVTPENLTEIYRDTHFDEIHFSAKSPVKSRMEFKSSTVSGLFFHNESSESIIREVVAKTKDLVIKYN